MSVSLAPMRWWHIDDVQALEAMLFPTDAWSVEQFWQELAQPTRRYLVATDDEDAALVGYIGMFLMPPDADVQTIAVSPDRQGRGIARLLLEAALADVERDGATHTMLEVRADNDPALGLYRRLGFERISTRPRYYADGVDAVIMRRARKGHDAVTEAPGER